MSQLTQYEVQRYHNGYQLNSAYVTVHEKSLHKSAKVFVEIIADFTLPIFNLLSLQISYG